MITLHHLEQSRSYRIAWILNLLDIPFHVKAYTRDEETKLAPNDLKSLHPLGKSPILEIDKQPYVESAAIIEYLTDKYDKEHSHSSDDYEYKFWLHYAESSLMPLVLSKYLFIKVSESKAPFFIKPIINKICKTMDAMFFNQQFTTHLKFVDKHLSKHDYLFADKFTAVDIQNHFPLVAIQKRFGIKGYPNISKYLERIEAEESFIKAKQQLGNLEIL
ncbi:glutathione S-transferase [Francisellaceae bacterium]|nr:glutathione S-transferase [Francisellaceae bacterium]